VTGPPRRLYPAAKRAADAAAAGLALVALAPVLGAVALAVRASMGAPVLFRQRRLGWRERPFEIVKFRTMRDAHDADGSPLPDADRLTRTGAFLRRTSLDELPQLWNVLRGEMSLVGPRPLYVHYLPFYTDRERRRHSVRPGITGLAQVTGRNTLPWDERLALDVEYVERTSPALDLGILFRTVRKVFGGQDVVTVPGSALRPLPHYRPERALATPAAPATPSAT
jgi:lipopolysaccharide/colanic/teichoic acid biosynthesis glycosyltransferase